MLFMLDALHHICFLDSWIGIVVPICFGSCLIVSALFSRERGYRLSCLSFN